MTWVLQAAVVLAVPLTLLGAVRTGVYLHRKAQESRRASAATAIDLQLSSMPGISEFKGWWGDQVDGFRDWLADQVDGTSSGDSSSSGEASFDGHGDASATGTD
ncbi:hypothetical protein [Pyxidicoccus trucidator]|uniref:hypothetical protein n=1 Tax=Pyxidicoccus trucidator TaxID=2709662 RepID=UPI0013DBEE9F|nr:hypothetical protein [Pyxidicoccus trucidator]